MHSLGKIINFLLAGRMENTRWDQSISSMAMNGGLLSKGSFDFLKKIFNHTQALFNNAESDIQVSS